MPSPTSSLATLRPDLASSLQEFDLAADRAGFIGTRVLPVLDVAKQAGTFGKIPLEQLLLAHETVRAPGSGYPRGKWTFGTATYATEEHGWEEPVDDREAQMYAEYFDAEQVSTQRAYDIVLREMEKRIAALIFNSTTWTGATLTTAVTNEWDSNHISDAVPVTNVLAAKQKVYDGCGMWPNALIICRKVFNNLRNIDDVTEKIASSGAGAPISARKITAQQLAEVFDLDYVFVAGGAKNTAMEGQTAALADIWDDEYAMVAKVALTQDPREPCLGRVFHWSEDGSLIGGQAETYRDETVRGNVVRVRNDTDEIVLYTKCAHLLSNITT